MDPLNRVVHVIILFALIVVHVRAHNKKMVCREMEDEEDTETVGRTYARPGKQGPIGPPGEKGEKGEKGERGKVDIEELKEEITKKVIKQLQAHGTVGGFNFTSLKMDKKKDDVICDNDDAKLYRGKCYWLIMHTKEDVSHKEANALCKKDGGIPGDILRKYHYDIIEEIAQATMPSSLSRVYIWTGMNIQPKDGLLKTTNGKEGTFAKWIDDYPSAASGYVGVGLAFSVDSSSNNGMWNYRLSWQSHGVLCQK